MFAVFILVSKASFVLWAKQSVPPGTSFHQFDGRQRPVVLPVPNPRFHGSRPAKPCDEQIKLHAIQSSKALTRRHDCRRNGTWRPPMAHSEFETKLVLLCCRNWAQSRLHVFCFWFALALLVSTLVAQFRISGPPYIWSEKSKTTKLVLGRESSKTKPFSKKQHSNNKSPPHLKPNNEVKVRVTKNPKIPHTKNIKGRDETLNPNIKKKNITTNNERWDVPASPFYYFFSLTCVSLTRFAFGFVCFSWLILQNGARISSVPTKYVSDSKCSSHIFFPATLSILQQDIAGFCISLLRTKKSSGNQISRSKRLSTHIFPMKWSRCRRWFRNS